MIKNAAYIIRMNDIRRIFGAIKFKILFFQFRNLKIHFGRIFEIIQCVRNTVGHIIEVTARFGYKIF